MPRGSPKAKAAQRAEEERKFRESKEGGDASAVGSMYAHKEKEKKKIMANQYKSPEEVNETWRRQQRGLMQEELAKANEEYAGRMAAGETTTQPDEKFNRLAQPSHDRSNPAAGGRTLRESQNLAVTNNRRAMAADNEKASTAYRHRAAAGQLATVADESLPAHLAPGTRAPKDAAYGVSEQAAREKRNGRQAAHAENAKQHDKYARRAEAGQLHTAADDVGRLNAPTVSSQHRLDPDPMWAQQKHGTRADLVKEQEASKRSWFKRREKNGGLLETQPEPPRAAAVSSKEKRSRKEARLKIQTVEGRDRMAPNSKAKRKWEKQQEKKKNKQAALGSQLPGDQKALVGGAPPGAGTKC